MHIASLLIFFGFLFIPWPQSNDPYRHANLLNYYKLGAKDEEKAKQFYELMEDYRGNDPLKLGYKAVSNAILAKYSWSPYSKIKHLRQSAKVFDQAVQLDKQDPEVRFLRYSIEYYIPKYLNMSAHLEEDKEIFLQAMLQYPQSGIPVESMRVMRDFLLKKEEHLTPAQRQQVASLKL